MATEQYPDIFQGVITKGAVQEEFRAGEVNIPRWAPVILTTAGSNETLPRVIQAGTANLATVIGVTVGPNRKSGYAADAVGDSVDVCTFGACKCKVLGSATIAIGNVLVTSATKGDAALAGSGNKNGFAKALYASTTDGDIIPIYICGSTTA